ncbi:MAG: penicillin acylase family protein [Wenzhouxiangella sp.]|nr:MAG: penicillin acylase family protein [Wenzhouxiangella sp.]
MSQPMRRTLVRSFWISLITVAALFAAVWFGGRGWLAVSLMPYEGSRALDGLSEEVEVFFDQRGIARVYGQSDADVIRALGWLHAGERLFQMELIRRMAAGELAALVGPAALELDVVHRGFGFARRIAEQPPELDRETAAKIDAYVAGINHYLANAERLPPEFVMLGQRPDPWTRADVLSVAYYQTFYPLTLVQQIREAYLEITEQFGPEAGAWLRTLTSQGMSSVPALRVTEASNTWVVAPERSASGSALHASDPHLEFDIAPGLWYAVGLHSGETLDVVGVTAPGLPFVAMGHNGRIAWAFTVAPVDLFDLYRLQRDPDNPDRVRGPDGWVTMTERHETIDVRDRDLALNQVYQYTPWGKVVESDDDQVLVLRWAGFELPLEPLIRQGLAINRAGDFDDFRDAAADMGALSVNWSYSDRAGNIGYVQSTPVPVRDHEAYFQILDGADPGHHWDGFHPPHARPHALNPSRGWLANANNLGAGPDWPFALPGFYYQDRIRRASDLLDSQTLLDQADMTRFQLDRVSDRALTWKDWLAETAEASGRDLLARDLRSWDGDMDIMSDVAGLFARWWGYLPRALFDGNEPGRPDWRTLQPITDRWLRDGQTFADLAVRDRDEAALLALDDALRAGARPLGMIQTLHVRHPLAQSALLDRWLGLSRGPFPFGGDSASLNAAFSQFQTDTATWRARAGASMRYTLDWDDPDRFTLNLALGQSGNPFSPYFDSFLDEFLDGTPWTVPWREELVRRQSLHQLRLVPPDR